MTNIYLSYITLDILVVNAPLNFPHLFIFVVLRFLIKKGGFLLKIPKTKYEKEKSFGSLRNFRALFISEKKKKGR